MSTQVIKQNKRHRVNFGSREVNLDSDLRVSYDRSSRSKVTDSIDFTKSNDESPYVNIGGDSTTKKSTNL